MSADNLIMATTLWAFIQLSNWPMLYRKLNVLANTAKLPQWVVVIKA